MPYEITYLETDGGVLTRYYGIVTDSDIMNSMKERFSSDDKVSSYRYAITDCTNVEKFDVSPEVMKESAEVSKKVSRINKNIAVVAIMPADLEFGMGRMWQAYSYVTGWKTGIVRTKDEAEVWLKENLE
jgi:hypothetical protein